MSALFRAFREPVSRWCPECGGFVMVNLYFGRWVFPEHRHAPAGRVGEEP